MFKIEVFNIKCFQKQILILKNNFFPDFFLYFHESSNNFQLKFSMGQRGHQTSWSVNHLNIMRKVQMIDVDKTINDFLDSLEMKITSNNHDGSPKIWQMIMIAKRDTKHSKEESHK